MIFFLKTYFLAFLVFFVLDMIWLGLVAKGFYAKQVGFLLRPDINWVAAILFYMLFILGLLVFVIFPALEKQSWLQAMLLGAFFGLVTYATYDLTNLATLKDWPLLLTGVDMLWGSVLAASVSTLTYLLVVKLGF